jgi:hypothetical protein
VPKPQESLPTREILHPITIQVGIHQVSLTICKHFPNLVSLLTRTSIFVFRHSVPGSLPLLSNYNTLTIQDFIVAIPYICIVCLEKVYPLHYISIPPLPTPPLSKGWLVVSLCCLHMHIYLVYFHYFTPFPFLPPLPSHGTPPPRR